MSELAYERRHELRFCDLGMGDYGKEDRERMRCVRQEDYGAGENEKEGKEFDDAGYWVFG